MTKNIFITGVNKGLGYELLKLFLKRGDTVFGVIRNKKQLLGFKKDLINIIFFRSLHI